MKKVIIFALVILCVASLFGCSTSTPADTTNVSIAWSDTAVDNALVGAWLVEENPDGEIIEFTSDGRIRFVKGTVCFEGDVKYGIDSNGNKKYFSEFYYMAGELNYMVEGSRALFVSLDGVTQTLVRTTSPEIALTKFDDFNADNPLIGTWLNEEYNDSYTFKADGTATYNLIDNELKYASHIDYTYKVDGDKVYLNYDAGEGEETSTSVFVIIDGVLDIDGSGDYKLQ